MKYTKEALLLCAALCLTAPAVSAADNILPEKFSKAITADLQHRPQDIVIRKIAVPAAPAASAQTAAPRPGALPAGGTAASELLKDTSLTDQIFGSYGDDENALRITGASVILDKAEIVKAAGSSSSPENGDFFGVNAALLASDGAQVTISDSSAESSVMNGNALFSRDRNTVINAARTVIRTSGPHSAGLMTAGGLIRAEEPDIITQGDFSSPVRAGQNGGVITVQKGTLVSAGYNAPVIRSAGDIAVYQSKLAAARSAGVILIGKSKVALEDCELEGNMAPERKSGDVTVREEQTASVLLLRSANCGTPAGPAEFSMKGGLLLSHRGAVFCVNRTEGILSLENVKLKNEDPEAVLLRAAGRPGEAGKAQVTFRKQKAEGKILTDRDSSLDLTLAQGTVFKGTISGEAATGSGTVLHIAKGARWELTGDSTVRSLDCKGQIEKNGHTLTVLE